MYFLSHSKECFCIRTPRHEPSSWERQDRTWGLSTCLSATHSLPFQQTILGMHSCYGDKKPCWCILGLGDSTRAPIEPLSSAFSDTTSLPTYSPHFQVLIVSCLDSTEILNVSSCLSNIMYLI